MATKSTATKVRAAVKCDGNLVQEIRLSDIERDWTFNARFPQRGSDGRIMGLRVSEDTEEGDKAKKETDARTDFGDLKTSIHEAALRRVKEGEEYRPVNNEEAVRVRPNKAGAKCPYFLVAGFLRCEAIEQLSQDGGLKQGDKHIGEHYTVKNPVVRCIVENLSEKDAVLLNISENTGKTEFSQADLACGVAHLLALEPDVSVNELSARIHKNQGYCQALINIVKGAKHEDLIEMWRSAALKVPYRTMLDVVKEETAEGQMQAFEAALRGKDPATTDPSLPSKGPDGWVSSAYEKGLEAGHVLGKLVRQNCMTIKESWKADNGQTVAFFDHALEMFVPIRKVNLSNAKTEDEKRERMKKHFGYRLRVVEAFEKGYRLGKEGKPLAETPAPTANGATVTPAN